MVLVTDVHDRRRSCAGEGLAPRLLPPWHPAVLVDPRRRDRRRGPDRLVVAWRRPRARASPAPDVLRDRGLPSLLLAPQLQDLALVPVRARSRRGADRPEGPAVVGGAPPRTPQDVRHRRRPALGQAVRILVGPPGLDPQPRPRGDPVRSDPGLCEVPG